MSKMSESIEGLPFSTRLRGALDRYAGFPDTRNLTIHDVIHRFRKDPLNFREHFSRLPYVGPTTFNELRRWIEDEVPEDGKSFRGRTLAVSVEEANVMKEAINEACNSISPSSLSYQRLRRMGQWLDAGTLHIEQPNDRREIFNKD